MQQTFLKKRYAQKKVKRVLTPCESCPGSDAVCNLLSAMDNYELGDEITYRQRVMGDHSTFMIAVVPLKEFIDKSTNKIWSIFCPHSLTAYIRFQF
jgi:hypothetical protein